MKLFKDNSLVLVGFILIVFSLLYFVFSPKQEGLALTALFGTVGILFLGLVVMLIGLIKGKGRRVHTGVVVVVVILAILLFLFLFGSA